MIYLVLMNYILDIKGVQISLPTSFLKYTSYRLETWYKALYK